jgi:hypothetical protein
VKVELFGMARAIAGVSEIELALDEPAELADFLRSLAEAAPALVPEVIAPSRDALVEPNLLLLDGRRALRAGEVIRTSDRPCVLFLASGG